MVSIFNMNFDCFPCVVFLCMLISPFQIESHFLQPIFAFLNTPVLWQLASVEIVWLDSVEIVWLASVEIVWLGALEACRFVFSF